jgi:hypothetical protein
MKENLIYKAIRKSRIVLVDRQGFFFEPRINKDGDLELFAGEQAAKMVADKQAAPALVCKKEELDEALRLGADVPPANRWYLPSGAVLRFYTDLVPWRNRSEESEDNG